MEDHFLTQVVTDPTRGDNILDLVFTNNTKIFHSYEVLSTVMSDHNLLVVRTAGYPSGRKTANQMNRSETTLQTFNYYDKGIDWENTRKQFLKIDWDCEFKGMSPDEIYKSLIENIEDVCLETIPKKKSFKNFKSNTTRPQNTDEETM